MWHVSSYRSGFTIVELLIVIVIIGVLAGLVISTFSGLQNRAYDTSVQSDVKNMSSKIEAFYATYGAYPKSTTDLTTAGIKLNKDAVATNIQNTALYCGADSKFAIMMQSRSGKAYVQSYSEGVKLLTLAWSQSSGTACPTNGGVPTTETGYTPIWLRANGAWATWLP